MRTALLIAAKDLRQRLRDRSIIVFAVAAPLGLAFIFSLLLGGATSFHADYGVADLDGGPLATTFTEQVLGGLEDAGVATIETRPTEADARQAVELADAEGWKADAAFVIPIGFSEAIAAGQPTSILFLGAKDAGLGTEIARSVAARFADGVTGVQLAMLTLGDLRGAPPTGPEMATIVAAAQQPAIALVDTGADLRQLSWTTFFSSAMAILFLFFAVQSGMLSLFEERRQGTLARMLSGPIRPGAILAGKALGSFVTGVASLFVLIVATTLMLGADWGPPPGVALIVIAAVTSAIGITTLVTSFMKTADGAGAANAAVAMTLGILGGTVSPSAQAPEALQGLSLVTPHAWFLRGLAEMQGGGTIADALPAVGVLLAVGLVTGAIGFARARRLVAPR
ncbi:MAG: ABC transporter permease [Chloroflexi bacterium]|nr:ABC transporter permease [Chloroflexota bacterium]